MSISPQKDRPRKRGTSRLLFTAVLATTILGSGTMGARAFTPEQWQHYFDCFHYMIFDPVRHREECMPNHGGPHIPTNLAPASENYSPVVVVVPQATVVPTTTVVVVPSVDPTPTTTVVIIDECKPPPSGGAQAISCEIAR